MRHDPRWLLDQAWLQVGRATTAEDTARALSSFRRAIATARKHASGTPELLERVGQLEDAAGKLYEQQRSEHVRKAVRALGALRMAVEARMAAKASHRRVRFTFADTEWEADADEVAAFYGIPPEFLEPGARLAMQLSLTGGPDVRVYGPRGGLRWSNR